MNKTERASERWISLRSCRGTAIDTLALVIVLASIVAGARAPIGTRLLDASGASAGYVYVNRELDQAASGKAGSAANGVTGSSTSLIATAHQSLVAAITRFEFWAVKNS
jgi:hypothetical protein